MVLQIMKMNLHVEQGENEIEVKKKFNQNQKK